MMKTSAADVSLFFTNAANGIDKNSSADSKQNDVSFASYMNNTAEKSVKSVNSSDYISETQKNVEKTGMKDRDNQTENAEEIGKQRDVKFDNREIDKSDKKDIEDTDTNLSKKDDGEDTNPLVDTESKTEEIKNIIIEKFGEGENGEIDLADIEEAMQMLNFTSIDLLDPDKVKDLIMSLTDQEDMISLLTDEGLYSDMMDVTNLISDITDEIKNEFSLTDEQFKALIEEARLTETDEDLNLSDEALLDVTADIADANENIKSSEDKIPNMKVEVNISEETKATDSKILSVTNENNSKQTQNWQDFNNNESSAGDLQQMPQQIMQTETVTVSDVVETVRQFSSYVDGNEIVSQVTEFIKVNISPETTSMELQLHPASLGTINMNIMSVNGTVTAQLLVQSESVKEALEAQLIQLHEQFEEQGTKVEAVEVAVASYDLDRGPFQDRDDRHDRQNADKGSHRKINLNLNDLNDEEISNLDEDDQLARHVMEMNGTSIDFSA